MIIKIGGLILIGIILLLPITPVHAITWGDVTTFFEEQSEDVMSFLDSEDIANLLTKIHEGSSLNELEQLELDKVLSNMKEFPIDFFESIKNNPEKFELSQIAIQTKINQILEILNSVEETYEDHPNDITTNLQQIGYSSLRLHYVYADMAEFDEIIAKALTDDFLDSFQTLDDAGNKVTLRQHMDSNLDDMPMLKNSDLISNPYPTIWRLYLDSEYIFLIPLIPMPENNLISIEEYCVRNVDEQKCDRLMKLGIFAQMMIKKDPNTALEAVRIIVIIAQDVNNETNAGYDSELEYAYFLSNMNTDDFINLEIFEMDDGSYVSLNDISKIECEDEISVLELIIEHIKIKKINPELLDEDFRLIMQNIDEIQNNQCTTMLTSIND